MMHNTLNINTAKSYVPYQDLENKDMMVAFLDHPDDYVAHVRRYTTSLTTQMVYGFRTTSRNDYRLLTFFEVCSVLCTKLGSKNNVLQNFEGWGKLVGGSSAQLLDLYPLLRKLPPWLVPGYSEAKRLSAAEGKLYLANWSASKSKIQDGTAHVSISGISLVFRQQS